MANAIPSVADRGAGASLRGIRGPATDGRQISLSRTSQCQNRARWPASRCSTPDEWRKTRRGGGREKLRPESRSLHTCGRDTWPSRAGLPGAAPAEAPAPAWLSARPGDCGVRSAPPCPFGPSEHHNVTSLFSLLLPSGSPPARDLLPDGQARRGEGLDRHGIERDNFHPSSGACGYSGPPSRSSVPMPLTVMHPVPVPAPASSTGCRVPCPMGGPSGC
jgi:hypothetical protein